MQHLLAKPITPLNWNDIPILLALAREGSMRKTSVRMGVDTSTISRRVAAAEASLQARLFIRGPSGYRPTDAGRAFLAAAAGIEDNIHSLVSVTQTESDAISGAIRITSVDALLNDWLIPRLPTLRKAFPQLQVTAIADNHALSFMRSEADLALRVARPQRDAAILMRRVGTIGMAVYGARAFSRTPRAQWGDLPWLTFNDDLSDAAEMQWLGRRVPSAKSPFRCSAMSSLIKACEAGLGLALLPCVAVSSKKIVRLSDGPALQRELWLLRHRDAANIRRFKEVADWLVGQIDADHARLSGKF